jgi:hypothetical protein
MDKWDRRKRVKDWAFLMNMFLLAEIEYIETGEIMYVLIDDKSEDEKIYTYEEIKEKYISQREFSKGS